MIYLIDDNQLDQQKEIFKANYLFDGSFKDYFELIDSISQDGYIKIKKKLINAEAIFLHNTFEDQDNYGNFIKGSTVIKKAIENDICFSLNIPMVLFSYGMTETIFDYDLEPFQIKALRKDIFYENLLPFLKNYRENKQLDFRILVYGINFNTEIALRLSREILKKNTGLKFRLNNLDLKELENYFIQTKSKMSFNEFLDYLEDKIITTLDFKELIRNINKSLVRYGRNIYN